MKNFLIVGVNNQSILIISTKLTGPDIKNTSKYTT